MRIVHINTFDVVGGAARAAYRLHDGLKRTGEDSRMFVAVKASDDCLVTRFIPAKNYGLKPLRTFQRYRAAHTDAALRRQFDGRGTILSHDRSPYPVETWSQCPESDVINLHWVANFLDYGGFFGWISPSTPVVWTLHDMNPFTGGCHYDSGCGKFVKECGGCPQLRSKKQDDLSRQVWARKRRALDRIETQQLHIVTPSRWLSSESNKSSLFSRFAHSVIPYGLDTDIFRPRPKRALREVLGIPLDAWVILFVADGTDDARKGFDYLARALEGLEPSRKTYVISLGRGTLTERADLCHIHIQPIQDDHILSGIYSTADVFVAPSLQDNLPNTVLESMACGTPVVGFRTGGIPDAVRCGETGLLAAPGNVTELREAILGLLTDETKHAEMAGRCRAVAEEEYALALQARRYLNLYEQMVAQRTSRC